jgi:lysozyme family protein
MKRNNWIKQCAICALIVLLVYLAVILYDSPDSNFEPALQFVLKWEGGYSNNPNDPGGETKFGICKKWHPHEDIKNMTIERATLIYYENYWLKANCDEKDFPFDIIVFDTAVNMGVWRAKDFLRKSEDWRDYLLIRLEFYSELSTAKFFFRGWANRVLDLYKYIKEEK